MLVRRGGGGRVTRTTDLVKSFLIALMGGKIDVGERTGSCHWGEGWREHARKDP